ncbi:MAG: MiaB/RimO family radical SAM methylthiotransferase, partial [Patescibacteria group bacterium]|nr:MiaB/RimO family radical SAM methylthiotransferase [Patescibacteria group bacterium]
MPSKTYHIITIGCQMNYADSERLAGVLEKQGYKRTDNKYQSDLVIVNTCGVRQSAENRIYGLIPKIKKEHPGAKVIVTGCLAERKDVKRRLEKYVDEWLTINAITNYQLRITNEMPKKNIGSDNSNYLNIRPLYESKFSAFVPIGNGCDNFCSYCVVPYARGREVYRPAKEILAEIKNLVKRGYKEIILIAQNVNSYKSQIPNPNDQINSKNKQIDFADLLRMVNGIKGDFWIRFLTSHPKDMSDKLIKTMAQGEKICPQVYLPVQAGDNEVLKRMNRGYTADNYIKLVKKIRHSLNDQIPACLAGRQVTNDQKNSEFKIWQPPVSITTDLIVGFPGETKQQFDNSLKLFRTIKFDMAYISEYSPRPGTAAYKLADNVARVEKRNRKDKLDKILRRTALANNKKYLGKTVRVLVEKRIKAGEWFGKTATGKDVRIKNYELKITNLIGKFVNVKI